MVGFLEASFKELREAAGVPKTEPHVTRTRAPRKAKPKARKAAPKPKPVAEPDVTAMLAEGTAEEETLEDATLIQEEELEPVL
jgi:hypothetical protein